MALRFVLTTGDFVYAGRPRPGFPLLLGDDMRPVQPFQDFLRHHLLGRGKSLDKATWEAYGRHLWDFLAYLHANQLDWGEPGSAPGDGVVARYRDWAVLDLKLGRRTVNARLRLIAKFYEWAKGKRLIKTLPFGYSEVSARRPDHDLAHLDRGPRTVERLDLLEDEWQEDPEFLTVEQIRFSRRHCQSDSRRLLFDLMLRVGLRSCEARTFPLAYVFDPSKRVGCIPGSMIEVRLEPRDMEIKFDKPRVVHVPYSLMESLHRYTLFERNRLASRSDVKARELILTVHGRAFGKDAVGDFCRSISKVVGHRVTALMLRHSYAIHTLMTLRASKIFRGEPLLYVRDRLGHSNVQTTMVYLRQIERLTGHVALAMAAEFDQVFGVARSAQA